MSAFLSRVDDILRLPPPKTAWSVHVDRKCRSDFHHASNSVHDKENLGTLQLLWVYQSSSHLSCLMSISGPASANTSTPSITPDVPVSMQCNGGNDCMPADQCSSVCTLRSVYGMLVGVQRYRGPLFIVESLSETVGDEFAAWLVGLTGLDVLYRQLFVFVCLMETFIYAYHTNKTIIVLGRSRSTIITVIGTTTKYTSYLCQTISDSN